MTGELYLPERSFCHYFQLGCKCPSLCDTLICGLYRYDALCVLLRHSKNVGYWFAHNVLFAYANRFSEYLLECLSAPVLRSGVRLPSSSSSSHTSPYNTGPVPPQLPPLEPKLRFDYCGLAKLKSHALICDDV